MRFKRSFSLLALLGLPGLSIANAVTRIDTRSGTKHWYSVFWDPNAPCGAGPQIIKCHRTLELAVAILWDQLEQAFDQLCHDTACSGSFNIMFPARRCYYASKLTRHLAYTLRIEAEYLPTDRDAVKATYMTTLRSLAKESSDCNFWWGDNQNQIRIDLPTDINIIVKDTENSEERSALHIMLDNHGESDCPTIDQMWRDTNNTIPGGDLFGDIVKGNCK